MKSAPQVVILAAGVGRRLAHLTGGKPKCLAEIGGKPLILHQLETLADQGAGPVLMVVGHEQEAIRKAVGSRVEYVVNERYRETNSLYSLWLARAWIRGPFVLLNADLFFDPEILDRLLQQPGNVLAYDSTSSRGREQTKVALRARRVVDLGKDLPPAAARGESLGILKFDAEGAKAMLAAADQLVQDGHERAWVIEATRAVCRTVPVSGINVAGLSWSELDFPHDLEHARREVWPSIWRARWRHMVYWRRTRWAAAALAALVLTLGGWFASTRVGPASLDWETVVPLQARAAAGVSLTVPSGPQRWWTVSRGDSLAALVDGPGPLRLEFRLLMAPERLENSRYVVAVSVDGVARDWETFSATPDSAAVLAGAAGAVVGDRDRIAFTLEPGRHTVRVGLLAGHGPAVLVRVRRPG